MDTATFVGIATSAVNTIVVAAGVTIAVRQLRGARHANELATLTRIADRWEGGAMREARAFVDTELGALLDDPEFVRELQSLPIGLRARGLITVLNFFDVLAMYIYIGAISERTVMLSYGPVAAVVWKHCRRATALIRVTRGDTAASLFEHLAMRAEHWQKHHAKREHRKLWRDPDMPKVAT